MKQKGMEVERMRRTTGSEEEEDAAYEADGEEVNGW